MLRALGSGIRSMFTRLRGIAPRVPTPRLPASPARAVAAPPRILLSDASRRGPPAFV
jgi:hypothetical protein